MKLTLAAAALLALAVTGALSELISVQPKLPVNPKHSFEEWQDIFSAQTLVPERCESCRQGTTPQPGVAGQVVAKGHDSRIIGGAAAESGQFPWQGQLRMDNSYFCGCSVISDVWILSAGHCVSGFSSFVVVLGSLYTQSGDPNRVVVTSRTGIAHENYDAWRISDDISVIKLSSSIGNWRADIRPILLPSASQAGNTFDGAASVLSGWGRYGTDSVSSSISDRLQYVNLIVIPNRECAQTFGASIRSTNVCTRGSSKAGGPVGACNGDSGGALVVPDSGRYIQVGIVSFGTSLGCNLQYPSAFTRVTPYLRWISDKTNIAIRN